jgi:hypothetical protein
MIAFVGMGKAAAVPDAHRTCDADEAVWVTP